MNSKFKKAFTYLAAAAFLFALAVNVKVTLDDPFISTSNVAIASTTLATISSIIPKSQTTVDPDGYITRCCLDSGNGCVPYNC